MSFFADKYALYVISAYLGSIAILGWLVWSSLSANARARRELESAEKGRNQ